MNTHYGYRQLDDRGFATSDARLMHLTGWCLLFASVVSAAFSDFSLPVGESRAATIAAQNRAFEVQVIIAALAMFELVAHPLRQNYFTFSERHIAARLSSTGSLLAALGYGLSPTWNYAAWLIVAGAVINLAVLMELGSRLRRHHDDAGLAIVVTMFAFGMMLIAVLALAQLLAESFRFAMLGPYEGFTLRTLRLARIAAIVLPVLSLLYEGLLSENNVNDALTRLGRRAIHCGVVGMAPVLFASGIIFAHLKTLLVIPSLALFVGVVCGFLLAYRHAPRLEAWGWLLIAASIAGGLVMGLYAFADPWVTLSLSRDYNGAARRLVRLAHVYSIILGLAAIFASRHLESHAAHLQGGRS